MLGQLEPRWHQNSHTRTDYDSRMGHFDFRRSSYDEKISAVVVLRPRSTICRGVKLEIKIFIKMLKKPFFRVNQKGVVALAALNLTAWLVESYAVHEATVTLYTLAFGLQLALAVVTFFFHALGAPKVSIF